MQELMWCGGLAKTLIPPPIEIGLSVHSVSATSLTLKSYQPNLTLVKTEPKSYQPLLTSVKTELTSLSKSYQPTVKSQKTEVRYYRFMYCLRQDLCWRWYNHPNIRFMGKWQNFQEGDEVKYAISKFVLPEVRNDFKWRLGKLYPSAFIEHKYVFRCLYISNGEEKQYCEIIDDREREDKRIKDILNDCLARFRDSVIKFEVGIELLGETNCTSGEYIRNLMLKRCLEIWPRVTREQINRGLALTEAGKKYVDSQIAELDAQKVIQKANRERWEVVNVNDITPQQGQLMPQIGVEAAKRRYYKWAGNPSP